MGFGFRFDFRNSIFYASPTRSSPLHLHGEFMITVCQEEQSEKYAILRPRRIIINVTGQVRLYLRRRYIKYIPWHLQ